MNNIFVQDQVLYIPIDIQDEVGEVHIAVVNVLGGQGDGAPQQENCMNTVSPSVCLIYIIHIQGEVADVHVAVAGGEGSVVGGQGDVVDGAPQQVDLVDTA